MKTELVVQGEKREIMEGYFDSARQAAQAWGRVDTVVTSLCRRGLLPGAFQEENGRWKIPYEAEIAVQDFKRDKLSEEDRREIARRAHNGVNRTKLAKAYGVKRLHVHRLMKDYPA